MRPFHRLPLLLLPFLTLGVGTLSARAGEEGTAPQRPEVVIHVPADQMDVLLEADRRGVVLRYDEYLSLFEAARVRAAAEARRAPVEAVLLSARGTVDLETGRLEATWRVRVLRTQGPVDVPFVFEHVALDAVRLPGGGRYEEKDGHGRLHLEGPGIVDVVVRGRIRGEGDPVAPSARPAGGRRWLRCTLPPAAAMEIVVKVPAAVDGEVRGEGPAIVVETGPDAGTDLPVRPAKDGRLIATWAPAARGETGPSVLDARVDALHVLAEHVVRSRVLVRVGIYGTPASAISLTLPARAAIRSVGGSGVVGTTRSDDRSHLVLHLDAPRRQGVEVTLDLETPYEPGPDTPLPRVGVEGAVRQVGEVSLRIESGVEAKDVRVTSGRRLPPLASKDRRFANALRYALADARGEVRVDLVPTSLRLESSATWYLNLTEATKTLLAAVTYRVAEGRAFELQPRFPVGYRLTSLQIDGREAGFTHELKEDGRLEIRLQKAVARGGTLQLTATLEEPGVDWVPDEGPVEVAFDVPSSGADREDGFLGVGADPTFRVLDGDLEDLVSVGAADLTARGITPLGLVYGYRLDGKRPRLVLEVDRRAPRVEARIVARVRPTPRRLVVDAFVIHDIERSGLRTLEVDVPAWAGDEVRIDGAHVVGSHRVEAPEGTPLPAGFVRWRVDLARRLLGRHVLHIAYHEAEDGDAWATDSQRPLAPRVPRGGASRSVVVERAAGLDVSLSGTLVRQDLSDLPPGIPVDPLAVREVVRLSGDGEGPGIAVARHESAPVLDAIARLVEIDTAVALAGILRSRATVHLVNVGLQFLRVELPRSSTLVGAVVDDEPVKPLVDDEGILRVPIPPSAQTGTDTRARLTYETRLAGPVGREVSVPALLFPGLEVLETRHRVALPPSLVIEAAGGDFGTARPKGHVFLPWVFQVASLVPLVREQARVTAAVPQSFDTLGDAIENPDACSAPTGVGDPSDSIREGKEEWEAECEEEPKDGPTPARAASLPAGVTPPGQRAPSDPTAPPPPPPGKPRARLPGRAAAQPAGGPPAPQADPAPGAEGPDDRARPVPVLPPRHARKKGLLSLDVPVLLSANRIVGRRLGAGGSLVLQVADRDDLASKQWLFTLTFLALGLFLGRRGGRGLVAVLIALVGTAGAALVAFGLDASLVASALVNAATLLVFVRFVRWLGRRTLLRRTLRGAAAAVLALAIGLAGQAFAGEGPAVESAPGIAPRGTIYVPYDPANPDAVDAETRVYVPLETWLGLRPPEAAPAEGATSVLGVRHRLEVSGKIAEVRTTILLTRRGKGPARFDVPLGVSGVREALLDGRPVPLIAEDGAPTVFLRRAGDHELTLVYRVPVTATPAGRSLAWEAPASRKSEMEVRAEGFEGTVHVRDAARVTKTASGWHVELGAVSRIEVRLEEARAAEPEVPLRTRAESRIVHRVRAGGTETELSLALHVLQGEASFVDVDVPSQALLLDAGGDGVSRWETSDGRVRLVFAERVTTRADVVVRVFVPAAQPDREEVLPALALRGTTGESGLVLIAADEGFRVEPLALRGLLRTATPARTVEPTACVLPLDGEAVTGAWRFAARPTRFPVHVERLAPRLSVDTVLAVVFGQDRVRSFVTLGLDLDARRPIGQVVLALPGEDEVLGVESPRLQTWWTEGEGDARTLILRYQDLLAGRRVVSLRLERRLEGLRDSVLVPRLSVEGAVHDAGRLVLYALADVEVAPGALPGLRAVPRRGNAVPRPPLAGASARHVFVWEKPLVASLPVSLGAPSLELDAFVVSQIEPSDEVHRLEHLVVFDVRRGLADQFDLFVPDGGFAEDDLIRAADLKEIRQASATRRGEDGVAVEGTLYTLKLQAPRGDLVEVMVSQRVRAGRAVRVVRPEGVKGVRWFGLIGTFLDGEARFEIHGADKARWRDLPFVPAGLEADDVLQILTARSPYVLDLSAKRQPIQLEADAVIRAAAALAVLGRDGHVRIQTTWRLQNRRLQFLRVQMPPHALLYGVTVAGQPVRPLAAPGRDVLIPVPKVPIGGAGYDVKLLTRAPAGARLPSKDLRIDLPLAVGVTVDRTILKLVVPDDVDVDIETDMQEATGTDVAADLAEAAVKEARELLDVAKSGTLAQRQRAAQGAYQLIRVAEATNKQAAHEKKRVDREVERVRLEMGVQLEVLRGDLETRARVDANRQLELHASNTVQLLQADAGEGVSTESATWKSGLWVFNVEQAGDKAAANRSDDTKGEAPTKLDDDVSRLKKRVGKALQDRERQGAVQGDAYRVAPQAQDKRAAGGYDVETHQSFNSAAQGRNFAVLNEALVAEQAKQAEQQAAYLQDVGVDFRGLGGQALGPLVNLDDVTNGLPQLAAVPQVGFLLGAGDGDGRQGGWTTGASLHPSSGIFFDDGADGDARARVENVFDRLLSPTATRRGLMGVDVSLPEAGQVFRFRSSGAGSPIHIDAKPRGIGQWAKWVVFLVLLLACAYGARAIPPH